MTKRLTHFIFLMAVLGMLGMSMRANGPLTWSYDQTKKILTVHVQNLSDREISAYGLSVTVKYGDGSQQTNEITDDYLPLMASVAITPDLTQKYGDGSFAPGAIHDEIILNPAPKDVADVKAHVDVIAYTDGTAWVANEKSFKQIVAHRKAEVLAFQKASTVVAQSPDSKTAAEQIDRMADLATPKKEEPLEDPQSHMEIALRSLASRAKTSDLNRFAQELQERIGGSTTRAQSCPGVLRPAIPQGKGDLGKLRQRSFWTDGAGLPRGFRAVFGQRHACVSFPAA